jgi:hypothetical protein
VLDADLTHMLIRLTSTDNTPYYLIIDQRNRVILDTKDLGIAELCEHRLSSEEGRDPEYVNINPDSNKATDI